jgi:hypothetical protein
METSKEYIDIIDRKEDYDFISQETWRAESGLRAIAHMYDDHSDDKNSYENILQLKDNINYRLFSASHQYLIFLKELRDAENYLQKLYQENPNYLSGFPMGNPYFDKIEVELSSLFDNIIFQISSVFDYLSHIVCYILFKDKLNTLYWTKLAKAARGQNNQFECDSMKQIIDSIDRRFVGKLYDYRSRLLHNKRDEHKFGGTASFENFKFHLRFVPSEVALKHFKIIQNDIPQDKHLTLTFLASWLIKRTFIELEEILDGLAVEIKQKSNFHKNLIQPKKGENTLLIVSFNPETKFIEPASEGLWKNYKKKNDTCEGL